MKRIPLPVKKPGGKTAADGHVAAGREMHRQRKAVPAPAEGEPVGARRQKSKGCCSLTDQGPYLLAAAVLRLQDYLIHRAKILYG